MNPNKFCLSLVHNTPRAASHQRRPFPTRRDTMCWIRFVPIPAHLVGMTSFDATGHDVRCTVNKASLSRLRLGLQMPFIYWIAQCESGKYVNKEGHHLLTCKHGVPTLFCHVGVNALMSFKYSPQRTTKQVCRVRKLSRYCVFLIWSLRKILNWIFLWLIHGVFKPSNNQGRYMVARPQAFASLLFAALAHHITRPND